VPEPKARKLRSRICNEKKRCAPARRHLHPTTSPTKNPAAT
jgi:hypothetical protein